MASAEVVSGQKRRRRWSDEQKRAVVEAAFLPGAAVCLSWKDQGRQQHGWWGHGRAPGSGSLSESRTGFDAGDYSSRIDAIAHTAFLNMPQGTWHHGSVSFDQDRLEQLRKAVTAWITARSLGHAAFGQLVDPNTSDAAIYLWQDADGIHVVDQWNDRRHGLLLDQHTPSERTLHLGQSWHAYVDRGESYYVVE